MSERISDCPPLLPAGEHVITVEQLWDMGVLKFPLSRTRREIIKGFERILSDLVSLKIIGDTIIDGSFLTEEIDPDDIDFTLVVSPEFYEICSPEQRKIMDWIGDDHAIKITHLCDCYLCVEYPVGHPEYFDGYQNRALWVNLYANSVVYKRIRGVAIIRLEG
jgi:hypothetical protein